MSIQISLSNVEALAGGLWVAHLQGSGERRLFGEAPLQLGTRSIVVLSGPPQFDPGARTLSFELESAHIANLGSGPEALIVQGDHVAVPPIELSARRPQGDEQLLETLPPRLRQLGEALLLRIRREFAGELQYHPASGKFVETPDNFWTVKIQPRDVSLRVTVRGRPEEFTSTRQLTLAPDMNGYSTFKLTSPDQVGDALDILRQVRPKRKPRP